MGVTQSLPGATTKPVLRYTKAAGVPAGLLSVRTDAHAVACYSTSYCRYKSQFAVGSTFASKCKYMDGSIRDVCRCLVLNSQEVPVNVVNWGTAVAMSMSDKVSPRDKRASRLCFFVC